MNLIGDNYQTNSYLSLNPKVIIVDDDKETIGIFKNYLKTKGIAVLDVGYNGKQAVELYQRFRPDIVLLDVMMPYFDGLYGLAKIRELDPNAKVIMVTADLTVNTEEKLKRLNPTYIVYKPYDLDELGDIVEKFSNYNRKPWAPENLT